MHIILPPHLLYVLIVRCLIISIGDNLGVPFNFTVEQENLRQYACCVKLSTDFNSFISNVIRNS